MQCLERKEKFTLFSDHKKSLLRRHPRAVMRRPLQHCSTALLTDLPLRAMH